MRTENAILSNAFRYFEAVARAGSIRAAARELNIASSAVNRQILMLEDALGLKLFERTGRTLLITEPGRILLGCVDASLADYRLALSAIEGLKGLASGEVHVACVESVGVSIMPRLIAAFQAEHPGIRIRVSVATANRVTDLVSGREADLGVTFNPASLDGLEVAFRRRVPVGAVVAPNHPLSGRRSVQLSACLSYPVAYPAEGLSLRAVLDGAARQSTQPENVAVEANSLRLMASLARSGDYVAFQTRIGIEEDLAAGMLRFLPLEDAQLPPDDLMLVRQKARAPSPAAAAFFEDAASEFQAVLDN